MGVYIKGMEMPCACVFCELYDGDLYWCRGAKREVPYSPEDKCAEFCPLVPVPKHGRLIDADEFLKNAQLQRCFRGDYALLLNDVIEECATIIPAEEGE